MKLQSIIKNPFRKFEVLLVAILLFSCSSQYQNTPQSQRAIPTKTKTSANPNNLPSKKNFSIQNANRVAPEDILEEVSFGGRGGNPGECDGDTYNEPAVATPWAINSKAEWLDVITISTCGWWSDNQVKVTTISPSGRTITNSIQVYESNIGVPGAFYIYKPSANDIPGIYRFVFTGKNERIEHEVNVYTPNGPRMYYINDIQSFYLYGFASNEKIRFFLYDSGSGLAELIAWENYTVDNKGQLIIAADEESGAYYAIGDLSGPTIGASAIQNKKTSTDDQLSWSCPGALATRLKNQKYAYVAPEPPLDQRVREGAGTSHSVVGYIAPGNAMKILDGPKCVNGWVWWKVQSIKKSSIVGWTAEGDDSYWLVPCDSLSSCP